MSEQIAELRKLLEAATPGPWKAQNDDSGFYWVDYETDDGGGTVCDCTTKDPDSNAALIVALRNSAPALLARLADLERLRKAIKQIHPSGLTIDVQEALAKLTPKT